MMNKRLMMLEKMVSSGQADSFARYALAMELKKESRTEEALSAFEALLAADPGYVPQYLMAGQMLLELGRTQEAKVWLEKGLAAAEKAGNGHALSELQGALAGLYSTSQK